MRFVYSATAALLGLALCNGEARAESPRLRTYVGRFSESLIEAGKSARAPEATLDAAARGLVIEKAAASAPISFGASRTVSLRNGNRIVRMPQMHKGLPVFARGAAVTFGDDDSARMVSLRLTEDLPSDTTPAVSAVEAAKAASEATRLEVDPARAKLVIWTAYKRGVLAWMVAPRPIPGVPFAPIVMVDAKSGEVIIRWNTVVHANANVYPSNPSKSPALKEVTLPLPAGATSLTNERVKALNCIDQKTVKKVDLGLPFPLDIHACDLLQTVTADPSGDFLAVAPGEDTAPEDQYGELSMFYHSNLAYDLFRSFDPELDVRGDKTPMPAVANLRLAQGLMSFDIQKMGNPNLPLEPFQNAFFSPGDPLFGSLFGVDGPAMLFGQGPKKDYGYDGDVIYHEFTHAVVNVTLKLVGTPHLDEYGVSFSPGGMNEALADYFSSAITGDADVGEYAVQDILTGSTSIRSLTNADACPTAIGGEVHQDATLFSGSLWDVRSKLSLTQAPAFDGAVYEAMNAVPTPADISYEDLAEVIVQKVEASSLGKEVADQLTAAFTGRGLLPQCSRILEYKGETLKGPPAFYNLWMSPGKATAGTGAIKGDYAPGVVQVRHALPENVAKLTISLDEIQLGNANPFGGGEPFAPVVLVKFGEEPIMFDDYTPVTPVGQVTVLEPTKAGDTYTAEIDVPDGTKTAHVMVGNAGDSDGAYTNIDMVLTPKPPTPGVGGGGGVGGSDPTSGGGDDNTDEPGPGPETIGGCGCSVPGTEGGASTAAALVAAAGLALSMVRRRRRSS